MPELFFNKSLDKITPSASMQRGIVEGMKLHNLAVGSPDILPPGEIFDMVKQFAADPHFEYQPMKGTKAALANFHKIVLHGSPFIDPVENITLVPGAKYGIYLSLKTVSNPGDKVLLLQPYWLSYPEICRSLNLEFHSVSFDFETFRYDLDIIKKEIAEKDIRAVILNNPNNPSGSILEESFLRELFEFCSKRNTWIILDEVYKDLLFDRTLSIHDWINYSNVIRIGSLSKSMSIPGFRIGYAAGSSLFIKKFNLFNQHISTCMNPVSLYVVSNLTNDIFKEYTSNCSGVYQKRYLKARDILDRKNFKTIASESSFYLLVDASKHFKSGEAASDALEQKGIMVTPAYHYGEQFHSYIRICLTIPEDQLTVVLDLF